MNTYVTGAIIKRLREQKNLTQSELAERLHVSDKSVSKWETGRGFPDITLLEDLSSALGVSVAELLSGEQMINENRGGNLQRAHFYVCPVCGNALFSIGQASISCCGIVLPPLEAEPFDEQHALSVEKVEDEIFVSMQHEMTKQHSISFLSFVSGDRIQFVKLYPEGNAEARFKLRGHGFLYAYCNHHGLFRERV